MVSILLQLIVAQLDVKARTLDIIADANANASSVTYPNTLDIVPLNQTLPNGQAAQFEIYTKDNNGDPAPNVSVTLSSTSGTLNTNSVTTDANGYAGPFTLVQGNDDYAEVTASATVTIPQGTRYVHKTDPDTYQKIVLATPTEGTLNRTAEVNWSSSEDDCDGDGDNSVSTFDGFKFEFDGVVNNGDGTSTWTYTVTGLGTAPHSLSHWVLGLCEDHTVLSSTVEYEVGSNTGGLGTGIYGVKWEKGINKNGGTQTFSFTLDGVYEVELVDVAFKASTDNFYCTILGPSCDETEDCTSKIGDFIWHDKNVNGIQDNNEPGIEGVVVELFDGTNTFTTTTDENGYYEFANLPNENYTVKVAESNYQSGGVLESDDQTKWYSTKKNEGNNDSKDSDADKGEAVSVTLDCADDMTIDFGYYKTCVTLIKEGPQTAEPGDEITYTFTVENCGDVELGGGVTVYDEMLNPNGNHQIKYLTVEAGQTKTFEEKYTIPQDFCGDLVNYSWAVGDPVDGTANVEDDSEWTTVVECAPDCSGEIGDKVWLDYSEDGGELNCNGIQDDVGSDGELGIPGVTVILKNAAGDVLATTETNQHGNYLFTELCAGTYYVFVDETTLPDDYTPAPTNQGNDDEVDSDDQGVEVVLSSDDSKDYSIDFGYCAPEEEPEVDIEVIKTSSVNNAEDGDQFNYIITVTNNGPDDAHGVKVTDMIPDGVVYIAHTASEGTFDQNTGLWNVGNLANGSTETLQISVQVDVEEVNNAGIRLRTCIGLQSYLSLGDADTTFIRYRGQSSGW
ncbi:MAG: SdrD B-like domain-containing protein [Melioribacteraceae bacterium]|nr:SdrD B-like domain-containing protein [Melioribacteraceae bacterium]